MAHTLTETNPNTIELKFRNLVQHGDDFYRIELLRHAKSWYKKALEMNIEPEVIRQKIADCDKLLKFERKVFLILLAIAAVLLLGWYFL